MASTKPVKRVFLIVLDSFGVGAEPDAADFGDGDCNTLRSVVMQAGCKLPNLAKIGLFNIDGIDCGEPVDNPLGAVMRLRELSRGKDTTIGHWELSGIVSETPLPTYPQGFPQEVIDACEKAFARKVICNLPYSGTAVINDYGQEHVQTGAMIVYTSADSVMQIAAHEEVVPLEELYGCCRKARQILQGEHGVGRVIARPFIGTYPDFQRTSHRHDFSLEPPARNMLDALADKYLATIGIGKISDIFAGRSISRSLGVNENNADGMAKTSKMQKEDFEGLCFVNLVDFDMSYGHRRDVDGYARALEEFDTWLAGFMADMRPDDVLMITADHGCDPCAAGTDHTREYVPFLIYGEPIKAGVNLGTSATYATVGVTVADMFGTMFYSKGESILPRILK